MGTLSLYISMPQFSDVLMVWPGLRKLDFEGCEDLADASVDGLTRLSSLTHLNVSDCPTLSQSGLSRLTGRMPRHCAVFHGYS